MVQEAAHVASEVGIQHEDLNDKSRQDSTPIFFPWRLGQNEKRAGQQDLGVVRSTNMKNHRVERDTETGAEMNLRPD